MRRFTVPRICVAIVAAAVTYVVAAGPASADPVPALIPASAGPQQSDHGAAIRYGKSHPGAVPLGTNNFDCKPNRSHPRPVLLVHGTDASAYADWAALAPLLSRSGYCVFALNYGGKAGANSFGTEDMWLSGQQLRGFADKVLAATGASRLDIVGYSQGATIARYYVNRLGGNTKVANWIGLASPTYGGVMYGLVPLARVIPGLPDLYERATTTAAVQQMEGSPFLAALNAGGDTVAGVSYTTIGTQVDEMIQPHTNVALRSPAARNLVLQQLCPANQTGHFHLVYDPFTLQLVLRELGGPANPVCAPVALGTGIASVIDASR